MSILTMCRSLVSLRSPVQTKDASGGDTITYTAVTGYTNAPCDIQPVSGQVREQYRQQQLAVSHTLYFHQDFPARAGHQVVGPKPGEIYQVRGYRPPAPGYKQWACMVDAERQYG